MCPHTLGRIFQSSWPFTITYIKHIKIKHRCKNKHFFCCDVGSIYFLLIAIRWRSNPSFSSIAKKIFLRHISGDRTGSGPLNENTQHWLIPTNDYWSNKQVPTCIFIMEHVIVIFMEINVAPKNYAILY